MVDYEGEKKMNNKNGGRKPMNCYEDECESKKSKNCGFDFDIEFDIDDLDECFMKEMKCTSDEDCNEECSEDCEGVYEEGFEEGFKEGFKEGFETGKKQIFAFLKKNNCCIKCKPKCKHNCKQRSSNKNKCFTKCEHSCKLRRINKNKNFHKMIKCM